MNLQDKQLSKKNYSSPKLLVYGNIAELTQNITDMGQTNDNPVMKT